MDLVASVLDGILLGGLYALFASGLSLIFGVMRLVNIAHGDLIVLSSFIALVVTDHFGVHPLVSLVLVVPFMALLGYALQRGIFNRALDSEILRPVLVSFGDARRHSSVHRVPLIASPSCLRHNRRQARREPSLSLVVRLPSGRRGMPEQLLEGRASIEQEWFFLIHDERTRARSTRDRAVYAAAYSSRDAIRAGDAWYQSISRRI